MKSNFETPTIEIINGKEYKVYKTKKPVRFTRYLLGDVLYKMQDGEWVRRDDILERFNKIMTIRNSKY